LAKKKKLLSLSDKMIKFIETLRQPTGDGVGAPMLLMDFQKDMIRQVYDPVDSQGMRIVNEAVLTIARKNGKTSLCASIALCHLWLPDLIKVNQEILILAWTREQANNLFKAMSEMIKLDDELIHDFSISDSRKILKHIQTGGIARIESAEAASLHGANPTVVMLDEIGNWPAGKAREIYSVVTTGFGARREALVWLLSTQSPTDNHIFSEKVDYGKRILAGDVVDLKFKAFIHEIPEGQDCFDEKNWIKSNPGLGVIRSIEEMRKKAEEARNLPSMANSFLQLFCNQRVDSFTPFITRTLWDQNNLPVDLEKLKGRRCFGGLDLSAKTDLTALVLIFPDKENPPKFDCLTFFWKPQSAIRDHSLRDRVPYETWEKQGFLLTTPGNSISYDFIAHKLYTLSQEYDVKQIFYDRWGINVLKNALDAIGCNVTLGECGQGFKDIGPCCNILEETLLDQRLRSGKNPLMTWCISNTVVVSDPAGSRKFDKVRSFGRIDGTVALGMALRCWELNKGMLERSIYDDPEFLKYMST
jgi:phage terminase large subunit-like protein